MNAFINFLRGSVRLRVTGPFPERFLNLCGVHGVRFWHVRWQGEQELTLRVPRSQWKRAEALAPKALCQVEAEEYRGLPDFLLRFRRRYGFLIGLACVLLAVTMASRVVLVIDVTGNETVPTSEILQELENAGLTIGTFGPTVSARSIAHRVLLQDERLCYMAVDLSGIRAQVIVRETEQAPEIVDTTTPSDLIATEDGVITRVEVWSGVAQVQAGDVVAKGDTLVSGSIAYAYPETEEVYYTRETASVGSIWARTWHTLSASAPLTVWEKVCTGETVTRTRWNFGGFIIKFYGNSGISGAGYDRITETRQLTLPGGLALPVWRETDTCRRYTVQEVAQDSDALTEYLKALLLERLNARLGEGESVTATEFTLEATEQFLTVTLSAECEEEISATAAITSESDGEPETEINE